MNDLKCMNWKEGIQMNELKRMTWMNKLNWISWYEWIEISDLTWMIWNTGMETNELPKGVRDPQFLRFCVINCLMISWLTHVVELSLQSRAHFVDLIFQKCSGVVSFLTHFFCETELSLQSRAPFADLIFPGPELSVFFFFFLIWALAAVSCTFCRPLSPIEPPWQSSITRKFPS